MLQKISFRQQAICTLRSRFPPEPMSCVRQSRRRDMCVPGRVALEIYSDQIAYYQNGEQDSRVLSAVYEDEADEQTSYGNKPQDRIHTARVYLENEPIRLMVEKRAAQAEADAAVWEQGRT